MVLKKDDSNPTLVHTNHFWLWVTFHVDTGYLRFDVCMYPSVILPQIKVGNRYTAGALTPQFVYSLLQYSCDRGKPAVSYK